MSRKVVDFGSLSSDSLREFFSSSGDNVAVVTDMMGIESLKRDGIENHRRSFEVLSHYAGKVVIAKPSGVAARMRPGAATFPDSLIDNEATARFPDYCNATLRNASPGVMAQIAAKQIKARGFVDGVTKNVGHFREALDQTLALFPKGILSDLRARRRPKDDPEVLRHIRVSGEAIAAGQFAKYFPGEPTPVPAALRRWLPFRYSVALYTLAINWTVEGGHGSAKAETLRNDGIDMFYVAYGTSFDGVISKDAKLLEVFQLAMAVLSLPEN